MCLPLRGVYCSDTQLLYCDLCQGVAGLLADFGASNLIEVTENNNNNGEQLAAINGSPGCTGCKSKLSTAVARCFDCSNDLCSNCVMAHQFMHCFEGHRVIDTILEVLEYIELMKIFPPSCPFSPSVVQKHCIFLIRSSISWGN